MRFLVTGGRGFIGSAVVRHLIANTDDEVLNLDKLTYASTEGSVAEVADSDRYQFLQVDICDRDALQSTMADFGPDVVMHLAAESHVDRSIDGPAEFIQTNVVGTFNLLDVARALDVGRFHHVSTDEVRRCSPTEPSLGSATIAIARWKPMSTRRSSSEPSKTEPMPRRRWSVSSTIVVSTELR